MMSYSNAFEEFALAHGCEHWALIVSSHIHEDSETATNASRIEIPVRWLCVCVCVLLRSWNSAAAILVSVSLFLFFLLVFPLLRCCVAVSYVYFFATLVFLFVHIVQCYFYVLVLSVVTERGAFTRTTALLPKRVWRWMLERFQRSSTAFAVTS